MSAKVDERPLGTAIWCPYERDVVDAWGRIVRRQPDCSKCTYRSGCIYRDGGLEVEAEDLMETIRIQSVKLIPDFYCIMKGVCDRMYICINPTELLNPVCPHLVVKSLSRKMPETISLERKREAEG